MNLYWYNLIQRITNKTKENQKKGGKSGFTQQRYQKVDFFNIFFFQNFHYYSFSPTDCQLD